MRISAVVIFFVAYLANSFAVAGPTDLAKRKLKPLSFKAVYDLTLIDTKSSSKIENATGRFVTQGQWDTCNGIESFGRLHLRWIDEEGEEIFHSGTDASYEKADGKTFVFKNSVNENGQEEKVIGQAQKETKTVSVSLAEPEEKTITFSENTIFPIELSMQTIEKALKGEHMFSANVYLAMKDGESINPVLVVIGEKKTADKSEKDIESPLQASTHLIGDRWPVKVSYYDEKNTDNEPMFVVSGELFEQGFFQKMKIVSSDYTLQANMTQFQILESSKQCGPSF